MATKDTRPALQREQSPPVTHYAPSGSPAPPVLVPSIDTAVPVHSGIFRDSSVSDSVDLIVPTLTPNVPLAPGEPMSLAIPIANPDMLLASSDVPNVLSMSPKPQVHFNVSLDVPPLPTFDVPSYSLNSNVPTVSPSSPTVDGSSCNHLPLNPIKPSADSNVSSDVDADIPNVPPLLTLPLIAPVPLSSPVPPTDAAPNTLDADVPPVPMESPLPPASSTPLDSFVLQRYEDIVKSKSDKRQYRVIVLSNHMKVFLVSDDAAETSAAALQVNVGHSSDPDELPGLAHLCEHMLFLGTEKYPQENEYSKFLTEHGGWSNACTGTDYTKYYFEVLPPHLGPTLDIFAQFFISPLFTESATERELSAVDSEHQKNVQSDGWRLTQVDKNSAKHGHPYRKFGTGNRQTLESVPKEKGIDVRQELLKFHQQWYSANIMALSVVGKESLYELEALVAPLFSSVKNSSVEPPSWAEHPFAPALLRKYIYCEPVADFRDLAIEFPVLEYTQEHYVGDPYGYLSHLIGHEGPGSLLSALKTRGWCNSLEACRAMAARGFGLYRIVVDLTEDGVNHVDDIVAIFFQYIAMLRTRGPQREVWEEETDLSELAFRFQEPSYPVTLANSLVDVLQRFPRLPLEDVLSTWRTTGWRPDLIEETLAQLTPQNVRVQVVAKCFANKCTQEEPWYGTKFLEEDIDPDKIKVWESLSPNPELQLPPPNVFIPSRVELEERSDPTCEAIAPEIIKDNIFIRLWFKQDNEFLLPRASIEFDFFSPLPAQSARNVQMTAIWMMLVEDSLQESTYAAGLASLTWSLNWCLDCITISIGGFDEKQHLLLERIMDRLVTLTPDPLRFAVMKEKRLRNFKNGDMDQPYQHADDELESCLSERVWLTTKQRLDVLESITVEMLIDYIPRHLRSVYVESIAFGNLTRARAIKLAEIVENRLPKDAVPVLAQELLSSREIEIEEGSYYLREISTTIHTASCAVVYVECGLFDTRSAIVLKMLGKILHEPCFDILRTKEQLGYIVSARVRSSYGVHGVVVLVQGDLHPRRLEQRIEAFLQEAEEYLENISEEEFVRHRSAMAALSAERPKTIYSKKADLWCEIIMEVSSDVQFRSGTRDERDVINAIAKEELIQFYKKHITPSSPVRRKLSVHVVSTAEGGAGHISDKSDKSDNKQEHSVHAQPCCTSADHVSDKSDCNDKHVNSPTKKREVPETAISSSAVHDGDKSDNDKSAYSMEGQELSKVASYVEHDSYKAVKSEDNDRRSQCSSDKRELSEHLISSSDSDKPDKSNNDNHNSCAAEGQELFVIPSDVENDADDDKSAKSENDNHNSCTAKGQELSAILSDVEHDADKPDKYDNDNHNSCTTDGREVSAIPSDVEHDGDKSAKSVNDNHNSCTAEGQELSAIPSDVEHDGDKPDKSDYDNHNSCTSEGQELSAIPSDVEHDGDKPDKSNNDNHNSCTAEGQELSAIPSDVEHDVDKPEKSDNDNHNSCTSEGQELSAKPSDVEHDGDKSAKSVNVNHNSCTAEGQQLSDIPSGGHDDDKSANKRSQCLSEKQELSDLICSSVGHDNDKGKCELAVSITEDGDKLYNDNDKQPVKITDLIEFKSRRRLYPRPMVSTTVPQRGS